MSLAIEQVVLAHFNDLVWFAGHDSHDLLRVAAKAEHVSPTGTLVWRAQLLRDRQAYIALAELVADSHEAEIAMSVVLGVPLSHQRPQLYDAFIKHNTRAQRIQANLERLELRVESMLKARERKATETEKAAITQRLRPDLERIEAMQLELDGLAIKEALTSLRCPVCSGRGKVKSSYANSPHPVNCKACDAKGYFVASKDDIIKELHHLGIADKKIPGYLYRVEQMAAYFIEEAGEINRAIVTEFRKDLV